jgi:hypothetical protein
MAKAKPTWVGLWRQWGLCAELLRIHKHQACLQTVDRSALAVPASHVTGLIATMLHVGAPMPVATIDALTERLPGLFLANAYGATCC